MGLIVLEGLDGSGKSTQFQLLLDELTEKKLNIKRVKFPDYDSPSSSLVKMYLNGDFGSDPQQVNPYAASSFYAADRYASFQMNWKKEYEAGVTIVADRYSTSNYIYQMGKLPKDMWEDYIRWAEEFEHEKLGLPKPEKVIFLDMPVEISQRLLSQRYHGDEGKKDVHESHPEFLRLCAECAKFAGGRLGWIFIGCAEEGEPLSIDEIHRRVMKSLDL